MDNLSFHITDITANNIKAKASDIRDRYTDKGHPYVFVFADNGCSMDHGNNLSDP